MSKPIVAIVGRPNVGKSMLFNKLTGKRMAIVEDTPGVTRDRIYGECEWNGRGFALVDTGGIEPGTNNEMLKFMRRQAEIAIETATVIIMVVDVTVGLTAADAEVASMLKRSKKPVVLAVNKCDQTGHANPDAYEFYALGLGDPIEVSAVHGHGTGDLLDACVASFPPDDGEEYDEDVIKVAIIGKPNVGKSSLLNKILGEERVIVSNVAGTTRDAIDSYFENASGKFLFIDTAGMRRKSKVDDAVEKYSNLRSVAAIERADVCLTDKHVSTEHRRSQRANHEDAYAEGNDRRRGVDAGLPGDCKQRLQRKRGIRPSAANNSAACRFAAAAPGMGHDERRNSAKRGRFQLSALLHGAHQERSGVYGAPVRHKTDDFQRRAAICARRRK